MSKSSAAPKADSRDRVRANRLRKAARPLTGDETKWLAAYTKRHPAPERVAKVIARELKEPKASPMEVHTGPPTPSITAPPVRAAEGATPPPVELSPEPAAPPVTPEATPAGGGLPPLPGSAPPPAPLPALTLEASPLAKSASKFFAAGALSWGRTLKQPFIGDVLTPYADAYGIALAEWYREKFGDGPIDRNKILIAGTVIAAGGIVEPFFVKQPTADEETAFQDAQYAPSAPEAAHAAPIAQPEVEEVSDADRGPAPIGARY